MLILKQMIKLLGVFLAVNLIIGTLGQCDPESKTMSIVSVEPSHSFAMRPLDIVVHGCNFNTEAGEATTRVTIRNIPCEIRKMTKETITCHLAPPENSRNGMGSTNIKFYRNTEDIVPITSATLKSSFYLYSPEVLAIYPNSIHPESHATLRAKINYMLPDTYTVALKDTSNEQPEYIPITFVSTTEDYSIIKIDQKLTPSSYSIVFFDIDKIAVVSSRSVTLTVYEPTDEMSPYISAVSPTFHTAVSLPEQSRVLTITGFGFTFKNPHIMIRDMECLHFKLISSTTMSCRIPECVSAACFSMSRISIFDGDLELPHLYFPFFYISPVTAPVSDGYRLAPPSYLPFDTVPIHLNYEFTLFADGVDRTLPIHLKIGSTAFTNEYLDIGNNRVDFYLSCTSEPGQEENQDACVVGTHAVTLFNDAEQPIYYAPKLTFIPESSPAITHIFPTPYVLGDNTPFFVYGYGLEDYIKSNPNALARVKDISFDEQSHEIAGKALHLRSDIWGRPYSVELHGCTVERYTSEPRCYSGDKPFYILDAETQESVRSKVLLKTVLHLVPGLRVRIPVLDSGILTVENSEKLIHAIATSLDMDSDSYRFEVYHGIPPGETATVPNVFTIDFLPARNIDSTRTSARVYNIFLEKYENSGSELHTTFPGLKIVESSMLTTESVVFCGQSWRKNCDEPEPQKANNLVVYIIAGAASVMLLLLIGYAIYLRKKKGHYGKLDESLINDSEIPY